MPSWFQVSCMQSSERGQEKGFVAWFVNWFYGTFVNYGTSPGRPLLYLAILYAVTVVAIYNYDGGKLPLPTEAYTGAYTLYLDSNGGWLNWSLLLPVQSILNPFSLFFDVRRYVIPDTWQIGVGSQSRGFSPISCCCSRVSQCVAGLKLAERLTFLRRPPPRPRCPSSLILVTSLQVPPQSTVHSPQPDC